MNIAARKPVTCPHCNLADCVTYEEKLPMVYRNPTIDEAGNVHVTGGAYDIDFEAEAQERAFFCSACLEHFDVEGETVFDGEEATG